MLNNKLKLRNSEQARNKKKLYIIVSLSIFVAIVVFGLVGILGSYLYVNNYMNIKNNNITEQTFIIKEGDGVRLISKNLQKAGLISNDWPLLFYLEMNGLSSKIIAGEYNIRPGSTPKKIVDIITEGKVYTDKITIQEGWTNNQIGEYLEKKGIVSKTEFLTAAKKNYDYDFLKDKPANVDLEGFLFPDTYQLPKKVNADQIVQMMLINFDKKLTSLLKIDAEKTGLNLYQIVTLASIVEREVAKPEDRKIVAGIFISRFRENMSLESCATIQYILGENKENLTYEETRIPSPYNTYLNPGLPLGPIGNPGIDSIKAVIFPEITEYRYFLSANGVTYFSKTYTEHEEKKVKYLQ